MDPDREDRVAFVLRVADNATLLLRLKLLALDHGTYSEAYSCNAVVLEVSGVLNTKYAKNSRTIWCGSSEL